MLQAAALAGASCVGVLGSKPDGERADAGSTADGGTADAGAERDAGTPANDAGVGTDGGVVRSDAGAGDPAWRHGLTPLTFVRVGNAVNSVNPANDPALNPNGVGAPAPWFGVSGPEHTVVGAWNGMTLHEETSRLRIGPAGGHGDYAGNEVYLLDLLKDEPAWVLEMPPTGAIGNAGVLDDGQESTNVYFDGRPRSMHTYDLVQARHDELWVVQPGAPYRSGGNGTSGHGGAVPGLFTLANKTWHNIAQGARAPGVGVPAVPSYSTFYDPRRDRIYLVHSNSGPLEYWDIATGTKGVTGTFTNISYLARSVAIPELDVAVILSPGFEGQLGVFDYDRHTGASGEIAKPGATGMPPSYAGYNGGELYPNGDWVPGWRGGSGAVFSWHGGTTFWVLTPPSVGDPATTPWAWSTQTAGVSNTIDPGPPNTNGVYSRLRYSRALRGLVLVTSYLEAPLFFPLDV